MIAYIACVTYYWKNEHAFIFGVIGQTFWIGVIFYACSYLGPLQIPVLFISIGYIGIAFVYYYKCVEVDEVTEKGTELGIIEKCASYWKPKKIANDSNENLHDISSASIASEFDQIDEPTKGGSDIYFKALFISCLVTIFYKQLLMTCLAFIPMGVYLCNKLCHQFGIKDIAIGKIYEFTAFVQVGQGYYIKYNSNCKISEANQHELFFKMQFFVSLYF